MDRTASCALRLGSLGRAGRKHGAQGVVDLGEARKERAETRQAEDLLHLRELVHGKYECEAEALPFRLATGVQQDAEGRGVDEVGVAEVDDDALPTVGEDAELVLEPLRGLGIVLADQGDHCSRRVPPS